MKTKFAKSLAKDRTSREYRREMAYLKTMEYLIEARNSVRLECQTDNLDAARSNRAGPTKRK